MAVKCNTGFYSDLQYDLENLSFFNHSSLLEVEALAASLSVDEVLDYYGFTLAELEECNAVRDLYWFNKAFKRGRTRAKLVASDKLFSAMSSRQGKEACIAYLKQFAVHYADTDEASVRSEKFSFTVNLDD